MSKQLDTLDLLKVRLSSHMKNVLAQTGGAHAFTDEDLIPLLLLEIATDTRKMLAIAEENQQYIRDTINDLGRTPASERIRRDGEDAPNNGSVETAARGTHDDGHGDAEYRTD